ncbi:Present in the outer mitochondrial membrane proteome 33 [Trypanosoma cruzi]|nr:Present in the outer mitochondrial membrane proteome 33 [Trypanosoma cruzi]
MAATRRISAAVTATAGLLLGGGGVFVAYNWWRNPVSAKDSLGQCFAFKALNQKDPRARFHFYATRNADGSEELDPAGLIACLCLLDEESRQSLESGGDNHLPPHVRQRLEHVFQLMDINHDSSFSYEEFCILLTLLSARREHLEMAFGVFDRDEDGRLSGHEFLYMLNALMVDPAVQFLNVQPSLTRQQRMTYSTPGASPTPITDGSGDSKKKHMSASAAARDALLASPLAEHFFGTHGEKCISFDEFWSMLCEIRREVWTLEFGLHDPRNTGFITLQDLQQIIFRRNSNEIPMGVMEKHFSHVEGNPDERTMKCVEKEFVSFEFYLKVFDFLSECDAVAHGMNLLLRAKLPEVLTTPLEQQQQQQRQPPESKTRMLDTSLLNRDEYEVDSAEFYRVLEACKGLSHLTREDADCLVRIFDLDRSGKLSPIEFAHACELRAKFFTSREPRFNEPQQNVVQRFMTCMQQLK